MVKTKEETDGRWIPRYGPRVILIHWLFIIHFIPLLYTGLLLMRDWFMHEFHIHGVDPLLITFEGTEDWHLFMGLAVIVIGLAHVALHAGQKDKPILPRRLYKEFSATLHNILYIFHLAPRCERGAAGKYKANQRMSYINTLYTMTLAAVTGVFVYFELFAELGVVLHVIAGFLVMLLFGYRVVHLIRHHDGVALKSILGTGRMPVWYVRKNHFQWYRKVRGGYEAPPDLEFEKYVSMESEEQEVVNG
jgi:cytochrome b subunit of formate dehydrogenase